jgi:phenylpyruvate tautomerase PptA (4-oxalocrotonate tautomerase family)
MTDRTRQLPPPARRDRDVAGFSVKAGELPSGEESDVVDLRDGSVAEAGAPANGVAPAARDEENSSTRAPAGKQSSSTRRKTSRKSSGTRTTKAEESREKELRRRLIATVTPPTREALEERARATQVSFADVLIEAWLRHGEALASEYEPDPLLAKREELGVRKPRHKRPPGRSDVQFYLTERELNVIEEGAAAAGYEVRSAYIEELLVRELGLPELNRIRTSDRVSG